MDRFLVALVCGLLGAAASAVLGAVWGGSVRALAHLRELVPDRTLGESLRKGWRSGAVFFAVLGGLLGFLIGLLEPSAEASLRALSFNVTIWGAVMLVIVLMIGVPSTILVRAALKYRRWASPPAAGDGPGAGEGTSGKST